VKKLSGYKRLVFAVFFLLFAVFSMVPDTLLAEVAIVSKVEVKGNRRIEKDAMLNNVTTRVGNYFSRDTLSNDIKRIFKMGYFSDVKVDIVKGDVGVDITFIVSERPFIGEIRIEGNKAVQKESIEEVLTFKKSAIFSLEKVKASERKISSLYEDKGYFLVDVSHRLETSGDESILIFKLREGKKVRIKKINILGNTNIGDKELRNTMGTREGGSFSWLTDSGKFKEETLQKDIDLITAFYYNQGFIQVKVHEPQVFLSPDKKWLYVTIRIDEGDQFSVGRLIFSGDLLDETLEPEKVKSSLKTKEGEIFKRSDMAADIVSLTDIFSDKGYAFADVSPKTEIDKDAKKVDLTFEAKKGSLVYVERINIAGNTKTRDKVIRRELKIREGDLYNGSDIRRSRQKVFNLGYFKEVNFTTRRGSDADKIELNINVEEGPTGTLSVGAGYSSVDGLVGTIQVSQANLMGRGHKLNLNAEIGGESHNYTFSFTEPYLFDTTVTAGADIFNTSRDYTEYSTSRNGFSLRGGVPLGEYTRASLKYRLEEVEVSDVEVTAPDLIKDEEGVTETSSISSTVSRDSRDNYLNPTEGSINSLSLEYAGGVLGKTNEFYKVEGSSSWFFPAFLDHTFMLRARAGYARGLHGKPLNIGERFFLGGMNTVRGFDFRSIGPKEKGTGTDNLDYAVGGNKDLIFNAEYIYPISKEAGLKGVLFYDAGNAFASGQDLDLGSLRQSVGFGFRWYSPVGPLRLEWAHILNPKYGDEKKIWEFSIGTFL